MQPTMELPNVKGDVAPANTRVKLATSASFDSERARKAAVARHSPALAVPAQEVETFRVLSEADKEAQLRAGLMENEFIAQYLDRQQMLSPNKKERMQTGMAVRVGIYNDKRNKGGAGSVPQNLIINLFNGSSAGPKLSHTLAGHSMVERAVQVIDSTVNETPILGGPPASDDE